MIRFALLIACCVSPIVRAQSDCQTLLEQLQAGEDAGNIHAVTRVYEAAKNSECAVGDATSLDTLAGRVLAKLRYRALANRGFDDAASAIAELRRIMPLGAPWQAHEKLADLLQLEKLYAESAREYQLAIDLIADRSLTPETVDHGLIRALLQKGAQARLLSAEYVPASRSRSGEPTGYASRAVRGFTIREQLLPVEFDTDRTTLTSKGRAVADDLVQQLLAQRPARIRLIGHTDDRGTDAHNDDLSLRRARAFKDLLASRGVTAIIDVDGRGKRQPLKIENAATFGYSREEIWQMNRRVELVLDAKSGGTP